MDTSLPGELQKELWKYIHRDVLKELMHRTRFAKMDLNYYGEFLEKYEIRPCYGKWFRNSGISWGYIPKNQPEGQIWKNLQPLISNHNLFTLKSHLRKLKLPE